ncbi:MAG: hypothetical protein IK104_07215 [Clostridia bacterium]|nr:hypothetical protein [Clostridia bacterium]
MSAVFTFLRKAFSLLFSLLFSLSGALSAPPTVTTGALTPVKEYEYPYSEGAAFCQGITTDGAYLYGTGCIKYLNYNAVTKIDAATGEILLVNDMCLPADLVAKGYSHLGDCAYCDGKLYAACEAFFFKDPAVMVFDADTLGFLEYHVLPPEGQGNGHFPWLCVDNGTVYYTQARAVDEVRMLDLADFSYKGAIKLDRTLTQVTGGDIYGGTLYLSSNEGGGEKVTYAVDLATGETTPDFVRQTGGALTEAEGLAVFPTGTGALFYYLDVTLASKASIRVYSFGG